MDLFLAFLPFMCTRSPVCVSGFENIATTTQARRHSLQRRCTPSTPSK